MTVTPATALPKVLFIPQVHKTYLAGRGYDEIVARSQFEILKMLAQAPGITVFDEGNVADFLPSGDGSFISRTEGLVFGRQLFPPGTLKLAFDKLSRAQKNVLFEREAVDLGVSLGFVRSVRATDSQENLAETLEWLNIQMIRAKREPDPLFARARLLLSPEYRRRIYTRRERDALERIQAFVRSDAYNDEPVALVFGELHRFEAAEDYTAYFEFDRSLACQLKLK